MASFFQKLKKGMGIEDPIEPTDEKTEEETTEEEDRETTEKQLPVSKKIEESKKEDKYIRVEDAEIAKSHKQNHQKEKRKEVTIEVKKERKNWFEAEGKLAVDVYQIENELFIQSPIAGVKPDNLDISIEGDVVTIKGERKNPAEEGNYFVQECYWGPFSREIILPVETDPSRAQATLKDGILTIKIPAILKEKKRKIIVNGE